MRLFLIYYYSNVDDNASKITLFTSRYFAIYTLSRLLYMLLPFSLQLLSLLLLLLSRESIFVSIIFDSSSRNLLYASRRSRNTNKILCYNFFVAIRTTLSRIFANKIKLSFRKISIKCYCLKSLYLLLTLLRVCFRQQ